MNTQSLLSKAKTYWNGSANAALLIGLSFLMASSCSRNAYVTTADPAAPTPEKKAPVTAAAEAPAEEPEVIEPTTPPIILVTDKKGKTGCEKLVMRFESFARPLSPNELAGIEMPYLNSEEHPIGTLNLGEYMTDQVVHSSPEGDATIPRVMDSQVVFGFDLVLPPEDSVYELVGSDIQLEMTKYAEDGYPTTELFCFLNEKICSGMKYTSPNGWDRNFNPAFWENRGQGIGTDADNRYFTDRFTEFEVKDIELSDKVTLLQGNVDMQVASLLENSGHNAGTFLYNGSHDGTAIFEKNLLVMVADDTYVAKSIQSRMAVELKVETCLMSEEQLETLKKTAVLTYKIDD